MFSKLRRPGHATVVAYLALFAALGGGAYAATTINGKQLVDRSVAGKKLKKSTVTGFEVNENTLDKVGSAKFADSAGTARASNVRRIDYAGGNVGQPVTLLVAGGMALKTQCNGLGSTLPGERVFLTTVRAGEANSMFVRADPPGGPDPASRDAEAPVVRGAALTPGGSFDVMPASGGDTLSPPAPSSFRQAEGQLVYRSATAVITVSFHAFVSADADSKPFCEFRGTALVG
jgi:hypothetical protein